MLYKMLLQIKKYPSKIPAKTGKITKEELCYQVEFKEILRYLFDRTPPERLLLTLPLLTVAVPPLKQTCRNQTFVKYKLILTLLSGSA